MAGIPNRLSVYKQKLVGGPNCVGWGRNSSLGAQSEKKSDPEKLGKKVEIFIFCCGFKKSVFVENGAISAIFSSFSTLGGPSRGAR